MGIHLFNNCSILLGIRLCMHIWFLRALPRTPLELCPWILLGRDTLCPPYLQTLATPLQTHLSPFRDLPCLSAIQARAMHANARPIVPDVISRCRRAGKTAGEVEYAAQSTWIKCYRSTCGVLLVCGVRTNRLRIRNDFMI